MNWINKEDVQRFEELRKRSVRNGPEENVTDKLLSVVALCSTPADCCRLPALCHLPVLTLDVYLDGDVWGSGAVYRLVDDFRDVLRPGVATIAGGLSIDKKVGGWRRWSDDYGFDIADGF